MNSGDIWFDGNDTRNPSDYHVGFEGFANGPGVGDVNTQKQLLDHIRPFMSEWGFNNAAKEKLEIVSGAAPPPSQIFVGGFFRKNAFGIIQEYCTTR